MKGMGGMEEEDGGKEADGGGVGWYGRWRGGQYG